ncbi:fibronectin type III domain-containing protein [Candidatus Roizmanbacteria bacterium]|nr:fibronectin type III domain-containing protein [Candidatus Roizmanbacteria bacterium]
MKRYLGNVFLYTVFLFLFLIPFVSGKVDAACKVARPSSPPVLLSAISGDRSVTLIWTEAQDPVTYYLLRYGTSKENFAYGNPNIGGKGTSSFTVGDLTNGTKYYFQVMAGNGCKPGEFSNTLTAVSGGIQNTGVYKGPKNLSIYKPVLGESTLAAKNKKEGKTLATTSAVAPTRSCRADCSTLPLLAAEVVLLLSFFFLADKYRSVKPVYSLIIPIFISVLFFAIQSGCTSPYKALCRYFVPLNIITYVSFLIFQRYLPVAKT